MDFDLIQFIDANEKSYHELLDLIPIPLFVKDVQGYYITCNTAYENISKISRQEMIGKTVYDLWPQSQADMFFAKDKELFDSPGKQIYEADISSSFGKKCIVQFHKVTFSNNDGETIGLLGAIFDLTEKIELAEDLKRLSEIDCVTNLLNRRAGLEQINRVLNSSKRNDHNFVIAIMDIDHFKSINDTHGHEAGDMVLQSIKDLISKALRGYDIVCRYGGEEFVFCFPETTLEEASITLERIRTVFESERIALTNDAHTTVTVSIGFAAYPKHGETVNQLLEAGDKAMYDAKSAGRNCVRQAN